MDDQGLGAAAVAAIVIIALCSLMATCSHLADITIGDGAGDVTFTILFIVLAILLFLALRWMNKNSKSNNQGKSS